MLSSISWQQYFAAIALTGIIYYSYVLLRYYQREITQLFTTKRTTIGNLPNVPVTPFQVMGLARQDPNITISDEQDLQFADEEPDSENMVGEPSTDPVTDSPSPQQRLIEETAQLITAFSTVDDKAEFISLLKILVSGYGAHDREIDLNLLKVQMIERSRSLPFQLAADDLPF